MSWPMHYHDASSTESQEQRQKLVFEPQSPPAACACGLLLVALTKLVNPRITHPVQQQQYAPTTLSVALESIVGKWWSLGKWTIWRGNL